MRSPTGPDNPYRLRHNPEGYAMTALTQGTCGQVTKNVPDPPVELQARREQRRQDGVTLAVQPDARPVTPNSGLVLVDQHEAQGWRVSQIDLPVPQAIELPVPQAEEPLPAVDLVKPPTSPAGSAATTDTERELSALLAEVVGVDRVEVDANFFDDLGADSMVLARFCARLRRREDLPSISMRDVYQHPTLRSLATAFAPAPAAVPLSTRSETEQALTEVLAEVMGSDQVTADSHFFDDLGADSMVLARFCARLRKREDLPSISIKDVYRHQTIRELAAGIPEVAPAPNAPTAPEPAPTPVHRASTRQYVVCGLLQVLLFAEYTYLSAMIYVQGYQWITAGASLFDTYLRSVAFCAVAFVVMCTIPILAKWTLIGRWKRQQIPIWSLAYLRFWFVKTLVRSNPLALFVGTPLYSLYLRALGAKVGKGVLIFSRHLPVCTDLVTIGDGTVIRKDSYLTSYRAQSGLIHTGRIALGKGVLVGEMSVLDVDTSMGDGAQLGHVSSLHAGQAVPAGASWHGSPAQPADVSYRFAEPLPCGVLRRIAYPAVKLLALLAVYHAVGAFRCRPPADAASAGDAPGSGRVGRPHLAVLGRGARLLRRRPARRPSSSVSCSCAPSRACSTWASSRTRPIPCTASATRSTGRSHAGRTRSS